MTIEEKSLRENVGEYIDQMEAIINRAEDQGREMTHDENAKYLQLQKNFQTERAKLENYLAGNGSKSVDNLNQFIQLDSKLKDQIEPDRWTDKEGNPVRIYSNNEKISTKSDVTIGDLCASMLNPKKHTKAKNLLTESLDAGGGILVPSLILNDFVDRLRAKSVLVRSGAKSLMLGSNDVTLCRARKDPQVIWHNEGQTENHDTEMAFEGVNFAPKTMMILVKASRELASDAPNFAEILNQIFVGTVSAAIDQNILFGTGQNNQMLGLTLPYGGVPTVDMGETAGGALTDYDPMINAVGKLLTSNGGMPSSFIMNPREYTALATLKDDYGAYMRKPEILQDVPFLDSTVCPVDETHGTAENASRILCGDWSNIMIGFRNQLQIELLKEKYSDSYSYGFLCSVRLDFVPARIDGAFSQITGIIPS